ncbi:MULTISPECIES: non-ribosomal peptide synthetase [unclassified Pseudoalteromonas]|uniref:non-ribosomal peptide synthetase n=1 Tax=unclassified Pseudoalteromonas TaxID=194690 RepID=UPI0020968B74|nr:non-ribosomal peptide synthetase [Pseudoalteromonas sp. XMcav2-N]MCO7190790.1 amino acid adenylation domain-containing protein [Pseudoalteromonas sp. XMcav2-N]
MKSIETLLAQLKRAQVRLTLDENKNVKIRGRKDALSQELIQLIKKNKVALVEHLSSISQQRVEKISRVSYQQPLPLSYAQQRIWFEHQMSGEPAYFNTPILLFIDGHLDTSKLSFAASELIKRHASLRTTYNTETMQQEVREAQAYNVKTTALSEQVVISPDTVPSVIHARIAAPFDITDDLLFRMEYFWGAECSYLLFNTHHIACDGWSRSLLLSEFLNLYHSQQGITDTPQRIDYPDYACWQRQSRESAAEDPKLAYWLTQLDNAPASHSLPLQRPRHTVVDNRADVLDTIIDTATLKRIKQYCKESQSSLFHFIHTVFAATIGRFSNQTDVVIGTAVNNRNHMELQGIVGLFVNNLVLRTHCDPAWNFDQCMRHVRAVNLAALEHQDVPFELLVEKLNPSRNKHLPPLFQIMLNINPRVEEPDIALDNQSCSAVKSSRLGQEQDLVLNIEESDAELLCRFEYKASLFARKNIESFKDAFLTLMTQALDRPSQPLSGISLLSDAQQRTLSVLSQGQSDASLYEHTVTELFARQLQQSPQAPAVCFGNITLSYTEFERLTNILAQQLMTKGVKQGSVVALRLPRSLEMVVAIWAVMKAGAAWLPIDVSLPEARVEQMIELSNTALCITCEDVHDESIGGIEWFCIDLTVLRASPDVASCKPNISGDDQAYVIFTSGTTGTPKGVVNCHRALANRITWMQQHYPLSACDKVLQKTPYSFDVSVWEFIWPLCFGGTLHVALPDIHNDPDKLAQTIENEGITLLHFVPSMLHLFMDAADPGALKTLSRVFCSGEALSPELVAKWYQHTQIPLHNLYGPTEAAIDVSYHDCLPDHDTQPVPIGKPIANCRLVVLDQDGLQLPPWAVGELYIGGVPLAQGYIGNEQLTNEKFVLQPYDSGMPKRLYKTGDLAYWHAEGYLVYLGRNDEQVKLRGLRIELQEIKLQINALPGVLDSQVVVRNAGSEQANLVCFYVSEPGCDKQLEAEIPAMLQKTLPGYMIPSQYQHIEELPLSKHGKVDINALLALPLDAIAQPSLTPLSCAHQQQLAELWKEVLTTADSPLGLESDFFELGGHSLLAAKMVMSLRKSGYQALQIKDIFEYPKLGALAEHLTGMAQSMRENELRPVKRQALMPVSFAQQRLWFMDKLQSSSAFNMVSGFKSSLRLEPDLIEKVVEALQYRHEVLNSRFVQSDYQIYTRLNDPTDIKVDVITLPADDQAGNALVVEQEMRRRGERRYDLSSDSLFQVALMQGEQESYLIVALHHIIADGWSMGVLLKDFIAMYEALYAAQQPALAPLSIQYVDYAHWQSRQFDEQRLASDLTYWQTLLAGAPAVHGLPANRQEGNTTRAPQVFEHVFSCADSGLIRKFCHTESVSLFILLQSVFALTVAFLGRTQDVVLGTPVAGREQSELTNLIGLFVNMMALRTQFNGDMTFEQLLHQNKAQQLDSLAHAELPFERLIESVAPDRTQEYSPVFQIMVNMLALDGVDKLDLAGHPLTMLEEQDPAAGKYELCLSIVDKAQIALHYSFDPALYDNQLIGSINGVMVNILTQVLNDKCTRLCDLDLLSQEQNKAVRALGQAERQIWGNEQRIEQLFFEQVRKTPQAIALIDERETLSYQDLQERVNTLAVVLQDYGVKPGQSVGVGLLNSIYAVEAMLAVLTVGARFVAIDAHLPSERKRWIASDSESALLITTTEFAEQFELEQCQLLVLDCEAVKTRRKYVLEAEKAQVQPVISELDDTAYLIYTSGSTGKPKGVIGSHGAILNRFFWMWQRFPFGPQELMFGKTNLSFVDAIWELLGGLLQGVPTYLCNPDAMRSADLMANIIYRQKATRIVLVPSLLQALLSLPDVAKLLSTLTMVTVSGEVLGDDVKARYLESQIPAVLLNLYGSSEVAGDVTYKIIASKQDPAHVIGVPISNNQVIVIDKYRRIMPPGFPGELAISGLNLASGYFAKPQLTQERFVQLAGLTETYFMSGDLVCLSGDGELTFLGRVDNQVKIRGVRVELDEIDHQLRSISGIAKAASWLFDEKQGILAATVVLNNPQLDAGSIKQHLKQSLPAYMIPSHIHVVDAMPLTSSGKIDRKALVTGEVNIDAQHYEAPEGEFENGLAQIWAKHLGLEVKQLGKTAHFFELGGHSLMSVKIIADIHTQWGVSLTVRDIFSSPTLSEMAEKIDQHQPHEKKLRRKLTQSTDKKKNKVVL